MPEIKTILVPIDFSERSPQAAAEAIALSKQFDAKVIFVHVIPILPTEHPVIARGIYSDVGWHTIDQLEAELNSRLDQFVAEHAVGAHVEKLLVQGDPATRIIAVAEERKADIIVLPTHGYGPFRRFLLGSVTSKVLHDAKCPVLTGVHTEAQPQASDGSYKRIACAVGLTEHSESVLRWAWELTQSCGGELTVIHAAPYLEQAMAYGEWFPTDLRESVLAHANKGVDKLLEKVGCRAEKHVADAIPVNYVGEVAAKSNADILVIGRSAHQGVLGRLRSDAYAMIREAPCPVISI